jgi:hypothetical protein
MCEWIDGYVVMQLRHEVCLYNKLVGIKQFESRPKCPCLSRMMRSAAMSLSRDWRKRRELVKACPLTENEPGHHSRVKKHHILNVHEKHPVWTARLFVHTVDEKKGTERSPARLALLGTWIYIWPYRQRSPNETEQEPGTPVWKRASAAAALPALLFWFWASVALVYLCTAERSSQVHLVLRIATKSTSHERVPFRRSIILLGILQVNFFFLNCLFSTFIWCDEGD